MIAMKKQAPTASLQECVSRGGAYRLLLGAGEGAQEEAVKKEPVIYQVTHANSATVINPPHPLLVGLEERELAE